MPEAEDVDVAVDENDLKIDVYRSSGPGGQSVNTTDSAVRITHLPSGIVVAMQDERSQLQNRDKAMRVLRARLYEAERERQAGRAGGRASAQVGTGERAEKIRTYNFPEDRVTDHRIKRRRYRLDDVLQGDLDEYTDALTADERRRALEGVTLGEVLRAAAELPRAPGRRLAAARRGAARSRRRSASRGSSSTRSTTARSGGRARRGARARRAARRARAARLRARRLGLPRLTLRTDPRALVPRPETEILVERRSRCSRGRRAARPRRRHRQRRDRARARDERPTRA